MATTDMQRLIVSLEARTKAFENAINKANGLVNRRARAIESRFAKMNKTLAGGFSAVGAKIAGAFAVAGGVRGAQNLIDSATRIENALKVAGLAGDELSRVYDKLFDSAQRNAAPLESLVTLYGRAAIVQKELGVSSEELLGFTDNVAKALRVAGTDAQSASGALLQLSQALGSGVVRAEEFNSILEGALPIAQAAAAGLDEAGGSVAKLRGLVIDGAVSSEAFFRAFEAGAVILQEKVAGAELTVSQRFVRLQNVLIAAAGKFDEASKSSETLGGAIDGVSDAIENFSFDDFFKDLDTYIRKAGEAKVASENWARALGQSLGLDVVGEFIANNDIANSLGLSSGRAINRRMEGDVPAADSVIEDWARRNYGETVTTETTGRLPAKPKVDTVSLGDFDPPDGKDKDKKARKSEYAREIEQIRERTAALQAETAAMAGLNPLINDYGFAVEKARAVAELENAALAAKVELTPQVRASIDSLATSYANAVVEAEALAEKQDRVRESAEEMADLGKDVFGGFISDMRNGKSAAEALQGALNKVLDELIKISLNSLFDVDGGGLGGILGSIGKIFGGYADGGYTGAGGKHQPAGVVHKGEVVFSQNDVRRNGGVAAVESMRRGAPGFALGGPVGVPSVSSPRATASQPQQITIHLVGEEGEMFTPRVRQISGETAGVVVRESRPQLSRDAVSSVQAASRNRPGLFRS